MAIVQDATHPTGVALTEGDKGNGAVVRARTRKAEAALKLKVEGYSNEEIARYLGYPSGAAVATAMEKNLQGQLKEMDKKALRQVAGRRLEQAVRHLHAKVMNPDHPEHLAAVGQYVKVIDRWAKLMGLDAPTEVHVTSPATADLTDWVESMLQQKRIADGGVAVLEEANVLDGDAEWTDEDDEVVRENDVDDLVEEP